VNKGCGSRAAAEVARGEEEKPRGDACKGYVQENARDGVWGDGGAKTTKVTRKIGTRIVRFLVCPPLTTGAYYFRGQRGDSG